MRQIYRKINLSQYKSFIQSQVKAIKDGLVLDVTKPITQRQYNTTSNYSMLPVSCEVTEIKDEIPCGIWSWHTLHEAYSFFKNHTLDDICFDDIDSYNDILALLNINEENYNSYRNDIIDYVEHNQATGSTLTFSINETPKTRCQTGKTQTYIALPINITNNFDNLGQVSNLLEEWKEKETYHSGNTVAYNNDAWYATSAVTASTSSTINDIIFETYEFGYTWNNKYKESVFGNLTFDEDEGYVERTGTTLPWELAIKNFAGSRCLGCVISQEKSEEIDIIGQEDGFIIYNNEVYLVKDYYFVDNFDCKENKFLVQFSCGTPYIDYDGEQVVGFEEGGVYVFEYNFQSYSSTTATCGSFIDDTFYEVETIDNKNYIKIKGEYYEVCDKGSCKTFLFRDIWYVLKNDNKAYSYTLSRIKVDKDYYPLYELVEDSLNELNISGNSITVKTENKNIESLKTISGTVASRLSMFRKPNIVDNLGNEFEASFSLPISMTNTDKEDIDASYQGIVRPNKGDYLSLPYAVGSAINLTEIGDNVYLGDIISCIKFYAGNEEVGKEVDEGTTPTKDRLKNIYESKYKYDSIEMSFEEYLSATNQKLKCEIIYNLGAVITATVDSFKLYDNAHKGVEYHDVYELHKLKAIYGKGIYNKYPVYMFSMIGEPLDDPFNQGLDEVKSTFTVEIPVFSGKTCDQSSFTEGDYPFDKYHGFMYAPTYMEEYNIGTAYQEKVFEDIYINRGISSAFEKHLKLQEIETFKDLENYSNGGFFSISTIN